MLSARDVGAVKTDGVRTEAVCSTALDTLAIAHGLCVVRKTGDDLIGAWGCSRSEADHDELQQSLSNPDAKGRKPKCRC